MDASAVAAAWSALLGGKPVGEDDDFFFDLGGHSLLGAAIVTTMAKGSGLPLELQDLYLAPTPREFAGYLLHLRARLTELAAQSNDRAGWDLLPFVTALVELGAAAAESLLPDEVAVVFSAEGNETEPGSSRLSKLRRARGRGPCSGPDIDGEGLIIFLEDRTLRVSARRRDGAVAVHFREQRHEPR